MAKDLETIRFAVEGMDCAGCAAKLDKAIRRVPGVEDVSVSVVGAAMTVTHRQADSNAIAQLAASLGYKSTALASHAKNDMASGDQDQGGAHSHAGEAFRPPAPGPHQHAHGLDAGSFWQSAKARLTLACGLALAIAFVAGQAFPEFERIAFLAAMVLGLVPIARRAVMGAVHGSPFSIETLMTVAAIGAVLIDATEEAAVVVVLFLVGELLEGLATARARASIKALGDLVPRTALRETATGLVEVAAAQLAIGDVIAVRPGDRVAADGIVVSGEGAVDEAPVTGEAMPKSKRPGDPVFAGTINQDWALRIRVTAGAADNTIARIIALVEEAQEAKAPTERFIDRFARYYTPAVMVVAALVALVPPLLFGGLWGEWIYKGLAILLIGCPCALVISTPAAIAAALAAGARRGLLLKGGAVLEKLGRIDMVAFDKTGTLTQGRPTVTDIVGFGHGEAAVLAMAAALEAGSSHPLATAILARAQAEGIVPALATQTGAVPGKGVVGIVAGRRLFLASPHAASEIAPIAAERMDRIEALNQAGKTVSVLLADDAIVGLIALRDEPRADAKAGLDALRALGARTIMLTGDNQATATAIGAALGIEPRGGLLPQDKQCIVGELKAAGHVVAKVGDGINDAPALAAADIGIAMGGGTDVALETADAAVLHGRVTDIARMVALSRATMANIGENITIALGLKAVFVVTTLIGITGLWPAILADTGATVLVTANAMRLLGWTGNRM